ncbi:MAG: VOC family protein [Thermaceae bacterium]|nr:VOC family protein [Thermaceae bacterium]
MKLNHLNLTVSDVPATKAFLEKYFGLSSQWVSNEEMAFLRDDNGIVLSLMRGDAVKYPGMFHVGFIQESRKRVNEINQRLAQNGFKVKPPREFHGSWTFYLQAPGGFTVEVLC